MQIGGEESPDGTEHRTPGKPGEPWQKCCGYREYRRKLNFLTVIFRAGITGCNEAAVGKGENVR